VEGRASGQSRVSASSCARTQILQSAEGILSDGMARAETRLKQPAAAGRAVLFAVQADENSNELSVGQDQATFGILAAGVHLDGPQCEFRAGHEPHIQEMRDMASPLLKLQQRIFGEEPPILNNRNGWLGRNRAILR
jgi:hypothetical protein